MRINSKKAFTLMELLIVVSILSIFIAVISTFGINVAVEGSASNRITYTEVRNSLHKALRDASTGYGGISLGEGIRDEKTLLPSSFVRVFRSSLENNNFSGNYHAVEIQKREFGGIDYTRVINKEEIEYNTSYIYLKTIRMKVDELDSGTNVNSLAVSFKNPTGKTSFFINDDSFLGEGVVIMSEDSIHTINEVVTPVENTSYNIAELDFYGNDGELRFTQKIYKDKHFPVSLN